ncbi:MAG: M61 family peptidase [Thermoplasmata archaeon]|nr:M61 family peptidase [Thermoplasmata archaeon]
MAVEIVYQVRTENPADHLASFVLQLSGVSTETVDVVFPSWVPGSYHIVDYVRKVRGLKAVSTPGGANLPADRVDKARWRIACGGATSLEVQYQVYGNELVTEALDVTPEHLFLNAALCLPYIDGAKDQPHDLVLHLPEGWKVLTELAEVSHHPPRFRATNYDELVDSPVDCGNPEVLSIQPAGIPHRIVLCGSGGNYEAHRLEQDIGKIVEATVRLFGDSPLRRYTFFYHLNDRSDGGLEHATSNSCVVPRGCFRPEPEYQKFLKLTSHEYFHLYNVKRIRPKVLGPFDYTRETYTKLLWAMEGTTDYYGRLIVRRAGLFTPDKYLEELATQIGEYLKVPGRAVTSLEDGSYNSWVDLYQPYEETINQSVSYYLKGELVSLCLDLEIRHRTDNRSSLDEVLRHLWRQYGATGRGLEEDELLPIAQSVTGVDLTEFFRRYIAGTDELDFARFARYAGLTFAPKAKGPEPPDEPEPGYLAVKYKDEGGLVRLR